MLVYITVLAVGFFLSEYSIRVYSTNFNNKNRIKNQINWSVVFLIVIILAVCSGIRNYVGTDFSTYKGLFEYYMEQPISQIVGISEWLFWSISGFIGKITNDVTWVFLFFALVISFCEISTIEKYTINAPLSYFLYITTMQYFNGFNGIRQSVAAAVMFAAFPLLVGKKWIWYFLLIGAMYFVHNSVVLLIPFTLIASLDPDLKRSKILFGILFVVGLAFPGIVDQVFSTFTPENYQQYTIIDSMDDGVNILRILVAFVPVAISRGFYSTLFEKAPNKKVFKYLVNFSTVNLLIWILASRSTILARFAFYTSIYNVLLIPHFLNIFVKEQKKLVMIIIMIAFFLYMYMLLPVDSNLLPYRTIFTR